MLSSDLVVINILTGKLSSAVCFAVSGISLSSLIKAEEKSFGLFNSAVFSFSISGSSGAEINSNPRELSVSYHLLLGAL